MIFNHYKLDKVIEQLKATDSDVTIAVTGDIHLHHNKVPTSRVIRHLHDMYPLEFLKLVDILVLNGDVLDRRLSLESGDLTLILDWFAKIMRDCKKAGTKLYVLEGTRSHDHRQSTLFDFVNELSLIDSSIEYIDTLKVVELPKGYSALFVPDEVNHDASVTATQAKELISSHGYEQVDFAFMHGMFRYQAPIETPVSHSEEVYEKMVKHRVIVNHIHTPSAKGIIRAPGSPVRLRHGEEETKGHYVLSLKGNDVREWYIETERNVVFMTIDVTNWDVSNVYEYLEKLDLETGAHLRLRMSRKSPVRVSVKDIKNRFPHYRISEDFTDSSISELGVGEELVSMEHISLVLSDDVIIENIKARVGPKLNDDGLTTILNDLIKEVS